MNIALVKDWMKRYPITIPSNTKIYEAHRIMADKHIRHLPVVENGKLLGIVTLGDLRGAEPSEAATLSNLELNYLLTMTTMEKIMTREVITVTPTTPLRKAAKLMLEYKIGGLPVLEAGKVVGIITESDIFRALVEELDPYTSHEQTKTS